MQNLENPAPRRIGPTLAAWLGCLGIGLLALLCLIVFGGLAYLRGYSLPPIFSSATPAPTGTPLPTLTSVPTLTFTPSPTFTATQTPTSLPTATIIFHTPTFTPTRTRTPTPTPTRTRTPVATQTPITTVLNDTQYDFNFNAWIGRASDQSLGNGMRCSSKKDELLTFETSRSAPGLSLFFYKGPNQGKASIIVDGVAVETIDLYRKSPQYRFEWNYPFPNPKQAHQVKVVVLREKRNTSTGYQVCFDGFKAGNTFTDDTNYGIRYDAWSGNWNGKALDDGYRLSATADSSVTFTIRGSSFRWITTRGPNQGQADIYVDDKFLVTVDLYLPAQTWQQAILVNNLGQGNHTVKIVVLGQHNSASGGNTIVFDGILVP